jgi:N-dimethylarginine dimethylaminohydrolase
MPTLLMCDPENFGVVYEINPWMERQIGAVDRPRAQAQWQGLHGVLTRLAQVELLRSCAHLPDLVFTANAGLVLSGTRQVVLSAFRYPERQGEQAHNRRWFEASGWECLDVPGGIAFEGAGDALVDSTGRLWVGAGPRTDKAVQPWLADTTGAEVFGLSLQDFRYYHLDTCFCPLSRGYAMAHLPALNRSSRERLDDVFGSRLIALSAGQAARFCANAVCVGDEVVLPWCDEALRHTLEKAGFQVTVCELDEFLKAGGAAKCLTLRLN